MQEDVFGNYEMGRLSHIDSNGLSVCTADGLR